MAGSLSVEAFNSIRNAVPEQDRDAPQELLDVGFSSAVIALGGSIVRVARTNQAREGHEREMQLLPWLDERLKVPLPVPLALVAPSPEVPFGAIVQPRLPGRTMTAQDGQSSVLCVELGSLLWELHGLNYQLAPAHSIQHLDPSSYLRQIEIETAESLRARLSTTERLLLASRLQRAAAVLSGGDDHRVLCHGDAWYGNVLVEGGHIVALLDLEDACVADPALDLAATASLYDPGPTAVLDAYLQHRPVAPSLSERIHTYALVRELAGLAYVLRNNISEELSDAIEKIRSELTR